MAVTQVDQDQNQDSEGSGYGYGGGTMSHVRSKPARPALPKDEDFVAPSILFNIDDNVNMFENLITRLADPLAGDHAVNLRTLQTLAIDPVYAELEGLTDFANAVRSDLDAIVPGMNEAQIRVLLGTTPLSAFLNDMGGQRIRNVGAAVADGDALSLGQAVQMFGHGGTGPSRSVAVRAVFEGSLAQLQATGGTIAGFAVTPGTGTNDLQDCGVLLLSTADGQSTLLPESGIYFLATDGTWQRATDYVAAAAYTPGLEVWADISNQRYTFLDAGAAVPGGIQLSIREELPGREASVEGVLHERRGTNGCKIFSLQHSNDFAEVDGSLTLSAENQARLAAIPEIQSDLVAGAQRLTTVENQGLDNSRDIAALVGDVSRIDQKDTAQDARLDQYDAAVRIQNDTINGLTINDRVHDQAIATLTTETETLTTGLAAANTVLAAHDTRITDLEVRTRRLSLEFVDGVCTSSAVTVIGNTLRHVTVQIQHGFNDELMSRFYLLINDKKQAIQLGSQVEDDNNLIVNIPLSGHVTVSLAKCC